MQRRIVDALKSRALTDFYPSPPASSELMALLDSEAGPARARWRWYTIDLLDLVDCASTRSHRESLHRAIRTLAKTGQIEISTQLPYDQPFAARINYLGQLGGGVDLSQLARLDPRWPARMGQALWFRLPPPPHRISENDQMMILRFISEDAPDPFVDFAESLNHHQRWTTPVGQFLQWLFCGPSQQPIVSEGSRPSKRPVVGLE